MHSYPTPLSPYNEARRRGSVLLYLPRETRDAIYTLAFTSSDPLRTTKVRFRESSNDDTPIMRFDNNSPETSCDYTYTLLPRLLLTNKAYPLFLQTSDFIIRNEKNIALAEQWLNTLPPAKGWKNLHRIVFPNADLFRIYSFNQASKVPWDPYLVIQGYV